MMQLLASSKTLHISICYMDRNLILFINLLDSKQYVELSFAVQIPSCIDQYTYKIVKTLF
uniref:Uncharacterized protein n=1 Tax=Arundo donax TaxID=35708 RepID=A0A0A9FF73_ARUDO